MTWMETAETEKAKAVEKLNTSERIMRMAYSNFVAEPTRANQIALKAAEELVKESMAEAQEWVT